MNVKYHEDDRWWVSPFNLVPDVRKTYQLPPRVQLHDAGSAFELGRPRARQGEVGVDRAHVRMQFAEYGQVVGVLVDGHQLAVTLLLELDDQVLADKPGRTGNDDLGVFVGHVRA